MRYSVSENWETGSDGNIIFSSNSKEVFDEVKAAMQEIIAKYTSPETSGTVTE